ncbi:DUF938 domain-containing protein [Cochlodiniinecator piscidefendens]|uniref:DUF938 domain-containing protein n=1 Tax=Cochlodiniinecator piscidefendens TaxID=2715756 RepID=UPI0014094040|nr:DUF938 domain-containing protein [Cochlodiniinecator piscidefendens]
MTDKAAGKTRLVLPDSPYLDESAQDGRLHAPSAARNLDPILARLTRHVPCSGVALEIASGTGQQIATLADRFPSVTWQPSDIAPERLRSIEAWRTHSDCSNLRTPIEFDATGDWTQISESFQLVYLVNLLHLITDTEAKAIVQGISEALAPGGRVFLYGPFMDNGTYRSVGDQRFDESLKSQAEGVGYKDFQWLESQLAQAGLNLLERNEMPANNLSIVAERPGE